MSYVEQAIKEAVEKGGYMEKARAGFSTLDGFMGDFLDYNREEEVLLSPSFWQALGVARGWPEDWCISESRPRDDIEGALWRRNCPMYHWHRFIDHRSKGKTAEDFFKELLN